VRYDTRLDSYTRKFLGDYLRYRRSPLSSCRNNLLVSRWMYPELIGPFTAKQAAYICDVRCLLFESHREGQGRP